MGVKRIVYFVAKIKLKPRGRRFLWWLGCQRDACILCGSPSFQVPALLWDLASSWHVPWETRTSSLPWKWESRLSSLLLASALPNPGCLPIDSIWGMKHLQVKFISLSLSLFPSSLPPSLLLLHPPSPSFPSALLRSSCTTISVNKIIKLWNHV